MTDHPRINSFYAPPDLLKRIKAALDASGLDTRKLRPEDLFRFDQFHIGGAEQTRAMARAAGVSKGDRVLDVGCAIGGSSRLLAAEFGATVIGVDAVDEFIAVAEELTSNTGLSDRVSFSRAVAPDLPFESNSFDLVWVQLVLMNIPDKQSFFKECARLLTPGGTLAILDVTKGQTESDLEYPVLWADRPEFSFLLSRRQYQPLLESNGFSIECTIDRTEEAIAWFDAMRELRKTQSGAERALSTALIISGEAGRKSANVRLNLAEGRIAVTELIARRLGDL